MSSVSEVKAPDPKYGWQPDECRRSPEPCGWEAELVKADPLSVIHIPWNLAETILRSTGDFPSYAKEGHDKGFLFIRPSVDHFIMIFDENTGRPFLHAISWGEPVGPTIEVSIFSRE